jgi:hypothetical protein
MTTHHWVLMVHVVVAVLGVSQAVGVALVAAAARRAGVPPEMAARPLRALLLVASVSVPLMFVSGGMLVWVTGGGYHGELWFRLSAAVMVLVGVLAAVSRRALRGLAAGRAEGAAALRKIERLAWAMCAAIAVITVLMEAKPTG